MQQMICPVTLDWHWGRVRQETELIETEGHKTFSSADVIGNANGWRNNCRLNAHVLLLYPDETESEDKKELNGLKLKVTIRFLL